MDSQRLPDDPVIEEIREIREKISKTTAGFSNQELLVWYKTEAQAALRLASLTGSLGSDAQ